MSFVVYAIRLIGDKEARYIGQTAGSPATRMRNLPGEHGSAWSPRSPFYQWLTANRKFIEAIEVARCDTRDEAKALERQTIHACLALGHHLFNRDHVPQRLRLAA